MWVLNAVLPYRGTAQMASWLCGINIRRPVDKFVPARMKSSSFPYLPYAVALTLSACASNQNTTPKDASSEKESAHDGTSHIGATAEVGALPEEQSVYAFKESFDGIRECFTRGASRIEFLGGAISVQVWVDATGKVQNVFAPESTLGDRQTERCMFDAVRGASWPGSVGGPIAMAQNSFEFEMTPDVRPPVDWSEQQVEPALQENQSRIAECKDGSRDKFLATVYVDTDGTALAVGMAAPDREQEVHSDCLVDVLAQARYPTPGSWPAKVTFAL
jgi:hypothetical protein